MVQSTKTQPRMTINFNNLISTSNLRVRSAKWNWVSKEWKWGTITTSTSTCECSPNWKECGCGRRSQGNPHNLVWWYGAPDGLPHFLLPHPLASMPSCPSSKRISQFVQSSDMDFQPVRGKNKKRFSDEQIKLLESMFSSEARPESQSKQQIANQLGLKPRQVAIWFQNRRARSKLKQIEHDYRVLKDSYDCLATRFESLKNENQQLINELQRLKGTEDEFQGCFVEEEIKTSPHEDYAFEYAHDHQTAVLCSPLSSGNGYSLESVFEPEDKCCSGWWEAID